MAIDVGNQLIRAAVAHADGFDDGNAELIFQLRGVDLDAALARDVAHVERQHHRNAEAFRLDRETQIELKIGRVGHANNEVRPRFALRRTENDVASDGFVGADGVEAVGAG